MKNYSHTKKGPGRVHLQGKRKVQRPPLAPLSPVVRLPKAPDMTANLQPEDLKGLLKSLNGYLKDKAKMARYTIKNTLRRFRNALGDQS